MTRLKHATIRARKILTTVHRKLTAFITPFGWLALAFGTLCLVLFAKLQWYELLVVAAMALMLILSGLVMALGNTRLQAQLDLSAERVTVGDSVSVNITVTNPGQVRCSSAWGTLQLGDINEEFHIPSLSPHGSNDVNINLCTVQRAVLGVGPLSVHKGDPLGLIRHERSIAGDSKLYIHPKTVRLAPWHSGIVRDLEGTPSGQIVDDDLDFYGMREYQPGDDIRNIHWLSTAKTGHLMMRQYEATKRTDTALSLSVNATDYASAEEFELAVCVIASVGVQCLDQHRPLAASAGSSRTTPTDASALLDWCSGISPSTSSKRNIAVDTLVGSPASSFYFLVVGSIVDEDSLRRIAAPLPHAATNIILQTSPGANRSIRQYDDFTLARLGDLNSLQLIMEALS